MKLLSKRPILLAAFIALVACEQQAPQSQKTPPPPEVGVVKAHADSVPVTRELVGRLAATRVSQVRARVAGIVLKRVYTEGTDVQAGDVLYQIDPAPLQAALHAREAALAKAQADAANAAATLKRYRELAGKKVLSQQDIDGAEASARSTAAAVKLAKADVETARLDLGYATVTAPIHGRAGRALVTEGALVGQGEATELTTIEQIDPIYVNFSQSVSQLHDLQKSTSGNEPTKVDVYLQDGTIYPHSGTLDFSDLAVDPMTGAMSLRAVVPNPDQDLLPGMFVKLKLTTAVLNKAYVIPQAAMLRDSQGAYVLIVGDDGKVEQRRVEIHGMTHANWILTGSLKDGDKVIIEGLQKVKPGATAKVASSDQTTAKNTGKPTDKTGQAEPAKSTEQH
jgi:membrane fusion protein (multidrug efflux system)